MENYFDSVENYVNFVEKSQFKAPLVKALYRCATRENAAFYTPGHKRGQGISQLHQLFGEKVFRADLPELPELDNLFAPEGVIREAQVLAADAFGAQQTWFLANGSTCGIEAAILTTCGPGDKLILPRNVHRSAISGLILSGAVPVYVSPVYGAEWDMALGVEPGEVEDALRANPEAKAVLIVSPTYYGVCSDLKAIARITHAHNLPLIVDEAHAPHFAFHPALPEPALACGADIVIQSAHKVLCAFTQAAMLHTQGSRVDPNRLSQCLQLTQSTSPSYLLLGSLDAARHQMANNGHELMSKTLALTDKAAHSLSQVEGIKVLSGANLLDASPSNTILSDASPSDTEGDKQESDKHLKTHPARLLDQTRLTVDVSALGLTGFEADEILHERYSVTAELPALRHLMFIVSLGNTSQDIDRLIHGFLKLSAQFARQHSVVPSASSPRVSYPLPSLPMQPSMAPRQAFFAPKRSLPISQAIGQLCGETICPYPPGIPTLMPGEIVTADAIAHLQAILSAGGLLTGCQDPTLQTILTVRPE